MINDSSNSATAMLHDSVLASIAFGLIPSDQQKLVGFKQLLRLRRTNDVDQVLKYKQQSPFIDTSAFLYSLYQFMCLFCYWLQVIAVTSHWPILL